MTRSTLEDLLHDIRSARIAIVGDFCLDAYWFLDPGHEEDSLETGLRTRAVGEQRYSLGGAGNVAVNLHAIGVSSLSVFGVAGNDPFGPFLRAKLAERGVNVDGLLLQGGWSTHVYGKPYRDGREENRIDFGNTNRLADSVSASLLEHLHGALEKCSVVVINQQVTSGIHGSHRFRQALATMIAGHPDVCWILDSRHFIDAYPGTIRQINQVEALRLSGKSVTPAMPPHRDTVIDACHLLHARWGTPLIVTGGAEGTIVEDESGLTEISAAPTGGPVDPVGAGDSMLAGVAAALAASRSTPVGAALGTLVAGVTVTKLHQTGTASPEELIALYDRAFSHE
jgi:sugar/nucleoside kinase (ribokinase family)